MHGRYVATYAVIYSELAARGKDFVAALWIFVTEQKYSYELGRHSRENARRLHRMILLFLQTYDTA